MPLNELFVITGCSRADMGTDAPIKPSSCPLHAPSGGVHVLLEKMLNLGIRNAIARIPQASSKRRLVKTQNGELEVWMVSRCVLFTWR